MTHQRVGVGGFTLNIEQLRHQFGGLSHVEAGDRVSQAALQADHWLEQARSKAAECFELGWQASRLIELGKPVNGALLEQQGSMA